jgi:GNAT superfamily N-acetyltransferase
MEIEYAWRGPFTDEEVNVLHAEGFDHPSIDIDWSRRLERYSLGWVTARRGSSGAGNGGELVGFVNVPWDGDVHAFILDAMVSAVARRQGVGTSLVQVAVREARAAGCEWLHVDFEPHLRAFYFESCGFKPTDAGLIALR